MAAGGDQWQHRRGRNPRPARHLHRDAHPGQTGALNGDAEHRRHPQRHQPVRHRPLHRAQPGPVHHRGLGQTHRRGGHYRTVATSYEARRHQQGLPARHRQRQQVVAVLGNGAAFTVIAGPTATLNSWAHVVGTYDGTTGPLYVDGIPVASAAVSYAANVTRPFGIGATEPAAAGSASSPAPSTRSRSTTPP